MKFLFIFLSVPFVLMSLSSCVEQDSSKHPSSKAANEEASAKTPEEMFVLGSKYYSGIGVPKNYTQAFDWFSKSAEQGNRWAQHSLGVIHAFGRGVPINYKQAFYWYNKSAEQGHVKAQYSLGTMYHLGIGVPVNYKQAYKWLSLSAAKEPVFAESIAYSLSVLEPKMTSAQISEAQKLVREFKPVIDVAYEELSN